MSHLEMNLGDLHRSDKHVRKRGLALKARTSIAAKTKTGASGLQQKGTNVHQFSFKKSFQFSHGIPIRVFDDYSVTDPSPDN